MMALDKGSARPGPDPGAARQRAAGRLGRAGLLALGLLAAVWPPAFARRSNAAIVAYNAGVKFFNEGRYAEALAPLDEAVSKDPDWAEAYYARAACRHRLDSPERALMDLGEAARRDPKLLDARSLRGVIYYELDRWDDAMTEFNHVLERAPEDAQSLFGRGVIALRRDNVEGARRDFSKFIRLRPEDPVTPKLRELLDSTGGAGGGATDSAAAPRARSATARPAFSRTDASPEPDFQGLMDLFSGKKRSVKESYGEKVLRGQGGAATGSLP